LSLAGRARVLLEPFQPARRESDDESVFDFARRRIGREAAEVLVDAMVTGIYAGDPHRLSLEAAFPRMRAMERDHGGLVKAMVARGRARRRERRAAPDPTVPAQPRGATTSAGPMGPGGVLTSFRGGIETFPRALAAALGDRLQCDTRVEALERGAGIWQLRLAHAAPVEAERVVLACPAWVAGTAPARARCRARRTRRRHRLGTGERRLSRLRRSRHSRTCRTASDSWCRAARSSAFSARSSTRGCSRSARRLAACSGAR
jgi:oxygen-dependent protoporphyrinogen oxidase